MDRKELYDAISKRKSVPEHDLPYERGNGRIDRCVELVKSGVLPSSGTLLDVGGSIGDLGYALRDRFSHRITLDISALPLESAAVKGNETFCVDVDRHGLLSIPDSSVDLIAALDFIEHIVDPVAFARECLRTLRSGGAAVVNTPNIRFWKHVDELLVRGRFPHTSGDTDVFHGGHLAFFTFRDLVDVFTRAGFEAELCERPAFTAPVFPPPNEYLSLAYPHISSQSQYVEAMRELGEPDIVFVARRGDV